MFLRFFLPGGLVIFIATSAAIPMMHFCITTGSFHGGMAKQAAYLHPG